MSKNFNDLLEKLSQVEKKKVSVAVAQDSEVLLAVKAAKERKIADSILVGDADKIKPIAEEIGMNLSEYEIVDVKDPIEAAHEAVKLVSEGKADMYMKGLIDTKDFLRSVLDKEVGLRTGRQAQKHHHRRQEDCHPLFHIVHQNPPLLIKIICIAVVLSVVLCYAKVY